MSNLIKLTVLMFIITGAVAFVLPNDAFALGASGDGGCCDSGTDSGGGGYWNDGGTSVHDCNTLGTCGGGNNDPDPDPVAKCVSFTADKTTVPHGGGNVKLTWSTKNATSVSINNGVGTVKLNGSKNINVTSNTTFKLTAKGTGGNDDCTVKITVQKEVEKPVAKCEFLNASKTVVKQGGETITLSWGTKNATSVKINNGVGTVSANGSKNVFVDGSKTFTLTATGTGGNDTCTVSITTKPPVQKETPSCDYFRADTDDFEKFGDRITLSWNTTNADEVTIDPRPGRVSNDGSTNVSVYDERTTFTLRARNLSHNTEAVCTVTVRVNEDDKPNEKAPRCDLEVSKSRVNKGDRVTLSWDTQNADEIVIRDDRGNTIFDTDDYSSSQRKRYLDGEIDVVINRSTEFTLNARGDGGSRTCRVDVKTDDLAVYEKRDQGYVIALTQVPYTGFEAGPFLTFLFYAMLTLWALFIAYVLVIKKSSILGFSLYGNTAVSAADSADIANRKKVEALVAKYSGLNQN